MSATFAPVVQTRINKASLLFEDKSPVLVEVRFPKMGTSPDWYLCQDLGEFESLAQRFGDAVEFHLHSVWDLANTRKPTVL